MWHCMHTCCKCVCIVFVLLSGPWQIPLLFPLLQIYPLLIFFNPSVHRFQNLPSLLSFLSPPSKSIRPPSLECLFRLTENGEKEGLSLSVACAPMPFKSDLKVSPLPARACPFEPGMYLSVHTRREGGDFLKGNYSGPPFEREIREGRGHSTLLLLEMGSKIDASLFSLFGKRGASLLHCTHTHVY